MSRSLLFVMMMGCCGAAFADGCKELRRADDAPTATTLTVEPQNPRPGQAVVLTAHVSTPRYLSVDCFPPQTDTGGYLNFYANDALIGSVRVNRDNAPVTRTIAINWCLPGGPQCLAYYALAQQATVSLGYTVPPGASGSILEAQFTGDKYFSNGAGSWSAPLEIRPLPNIAPVIDYLLL